jgi:imidazoleglycerol-phosphate dehydratase/histidinol-phosphatase
VGVKKRAIFLDRDGTVIVEPADNKQVDSLDKLNFIPGAIGALSLIARLTGYKLVMVTNQDGLGTPSFPYESFEPAHNKMLSILSGEGVVFADILIDRSFPEDNLPTRKPGTALLGKYMAGEYDLARSFVVGDRDTDIALAKNLGASGILFAEKRGIGEVLATTSWSEVAKFVLGQWRRAVVSRVTNETSISLELALAGSANRRISTGLGFLDHMLDLLAAHAGFDLVIDAKGDLHVDEHHLVEDVGIVLGEAIREALGDKRGISRFGFLAPMDESIAEVALDLSNRPKFVWSGEFMRERIGDLPTELIPHFFESLTSSLRCALHISVRGENEHHKAEAVFKGVGRALRSACAIDGSGYDVPSTKGVL